MKNKKEKNIKKFWLTKQPYLELPFTAKLQIRKFIFLNQNIGIFFFCLFYNYAIVCKCQNFLKVGVHMIITDQYNQTAS